MWASDRIHPNIHTRCAVSVSSFRSTVPAHQVLDGTVDTPVKLASSLVGAGRFRRGAAIQHVGEPLQVLDSVRRPNASQDRDQPLLQPLAGPNRRVVLPLPLKAQFPPQNLLGVLHRRQQPDHVNRAPLDSPV